MSAPLVSVVMPVYNGEQFVAEAITSVLALGLPDLEIIVVDDGSTDASLRAADLEGPIRLVRQARSGPAAARNHGLRLARGPIVGLLDADDRWTSAVANILLPMLLRDDRLEIAQGRIEEFRTPGDAGLTRGPYDYLNLGSALYRRGVFDRVGPFDEDLHQSEDYDWMLRAFDRRVRKARVADTTLLYRVHAGGATSGRSLHDIRMAYVHKKAAARRRAHPDLCDVPADFPSLADYIGRGAAGASVPDRSELTRCDSRPIDPPDDAVLAFMVVRDEARRLPHCLDHHRRLGVARFFIVDNGSDDGSAAWLLEQPDVHLWRTTASFGAARCGTDWTEALLRAHGQGRWCLVVDADELLVYPDSETTPIATFCRRLEQGGHAAAMATMVDMYSRQPIRDAHLDAGQPFLEVCQYFDRRVVHDAVDRFHDHDQHPSLFGGVRRRVFGGHEPGQDERFFYCLNKVPLLKYSSSIALSDNLHWTSCRDVAVRAAALLHFKFTADFADRAARESLRKEHWNQGVQYAYYADAIRRDGALTLYDPAASIRYQGTAQLVEIGVLQPVAGADLSRGRIAVPANEPRAGTPAAAGPAPDGQSGMLRQVRALIAARKGRQPNAHADAMALLKQGSWREAADAFRAALADAPDFAWSHHYLGDALMALQQWTAAAAAYSRATALNPHFAPSHFNLAEVHARLEQWVDAAQRYRRAIALQADLPNAARNLARVLVRQARQLEQEARDLYARAHECAPADMAIYSEAAGLRPPDPDLFLRFADALADLEYRTRAIVFYQLALQYRPDDASAHARLAQVLRKDGDLARAIDCGRRAVLLDEQCAAHHAALGAMLAEAGQTDDAIAAYRQSVALDPARPAWLKDLGDLLARAGHLDEAASVYAQALSQGYQPVPTMDRADRRPIVPTPHALTPREPREAMARVGAPVVEIRPDRAWHDVDLREVWRYRDMLLLLVQRDVMVRYKQTVLGVSWAVLQPLGPMLVFTLIFTRFVRMPVGEHPYAVFVLSGLVPWTFFSSSVSAASSSLVSHAHVLSKVYFPRIVLPAAAVLAKLVDLLIGCALLIAMMLIYRVTPSISLVLLPIALAPLLVLAMAVGLNVAAINTTYRDAGHALPLVLQLWLFLTPVVYARSVVPAEWAWLLLLNPVTGILESFRAVLLAQPIPWVHLACSSLLAGGLLLSGLVLFARMEKHLADHL